MRAGELRHFITVFAPIGVLHETEPVDVATNVPMKIEVLPLAFQAREALNLGGPQTQTLYTLTARYREDIRASYVLNEQCCTQRSFQILAVIPGDRRDSVQMTCVTSA